MLIARLHGLIKMKRTKITIDGVPIILSEDNGCEYVELCGELAEEADEIRIKFGINKNPDCSYKYLN